jgi:hypothetical protein
MSGIIEPMLRPRGEPECSTGSRARAAWGCSIRGPHALTMDFNPGDIGHYILNVGDTDLHFLEVFRSSLCVPKT